MTSTLFKAKKGLLVPAVDLCQPSVIRALTKAGWRVGAHPRRVHTPHRTILIDLVAQHIGGRVYIEVKCFADVTDTDEQYRAIGQYLTYRAVLQAVEGKTPLYLAIPVTMDQEMDAVLRHLLKEYQIKYVLFDEAEEAIRSWNE
jgi:XisH protein